VLFPRALLLPPVPRSAVWGAPSRGKVPFAAAVAPAALLLAPISVAFLRIVVDIGLLVLAPSNYPIYVVIRTIRGAAVLHEHALVVEHVEARLPIEAFALLHAQRHPATRAPEAGFVPLPPAALVPVMTATENAVCALVLCVTTRMARSPLQREEPVHALFGEARFVELHHCSPLRAYAGLHTLRETPKMNAR